jgi:hypothetical protein
LDTKESKPIHIKTETKKVNKEKFKAVFRIKVKFSFGTKRIKKEPIKGNKIKISNNMTYLTKLLI